MQDAQVWPAGTTGFNVVELPSGEMFQHYAVERLEQYTGEDSQELLATYIRVGRLWFQIAEPQNLEVTSTRLIEKLDAAVTASREYAARP